VSSTPDWSRVRSGLESLLDGGHADAVVELGPELLEAGAEQVERAHDDGETGMEIADCLSVVARALRASSLPDPEKILYAIDRSLEDDYELAGELVRVVQRRWSRPTWSAVADALARRSEAGRAPGARGVHDEHHRRRLCAWLVSALDAAGREEEGTAVLADEAPRTGDYEQLVRRLIEVKRLDEAREWAERGYAAALDERPGRAAGLRALLADIARRRRQWELVAAYEAERCFERPDVAGLKALQAAARKAGREDEVRGAALRFLETGRAPARSRRWPLPATGLARPRRTGRHGTAEPTPRWDVLRDLAIEEGRPDDVLRWHDRLAESRRFRLPTPSDEDLRVARAVSATHPDRAIDIYREAAVSLIERAKPEAYAQAGALLRRVRELLAGSARSHEWPAILAGLREIHARKRRLMEVLDGLEGRPIVGGGGKARGRRKRRR
jgi:uncharacterized Zn finger protein